MKESGFDIQVLCKEASMHLDYDYGPHCHVSDDWCKVLVEIDVWDLCITLGNKSGTKNSVLLTFEDPFVVD